MAVQAAKHTSNRRFDKTPQAAQEITPPKVKMSTTLGCLKKAQ